MWKVFQTSKRELFECIDEIFSRCVRSDIKHFWTTQNYKCYAGCDKKELEKIRKSRTNITNNLKKELQNNIEFAQLNSSRGRMSSEKCWYIYPSSMMYWLGSSSQLVTYPTKRGIFLPCKQTSYLKNKQKSSKVAF